MRCRRDGVLTEWYSEPATRQGRTPANNRSNGASRASTVVAALRDPIVMMDAIDVWKQCGLPELAIPKRAKLRIEKS
jgi:hypothetical protein